MRILLLNPPFIKNFIRSARSTWPSISGSNWYPIFLGYAAGWLQIHGHTVKLLDALVEEMVTSQVIASSKHFKPDLLALYISQQSIKSDITFAQKIKKATKCQVVLVGPWCSYDPKGLLETYDVVDYVAKREFEDILLDLANGRSTKDILGLAYRSGRNVIMNGERPFLTTKQLDQFPFVTKIYKEFLPIEKYHQASLLHPYVDVFTARGCVWGKCTFCLWPHTIHGGATYRARSIDNVMEEISYIKKELPFVKEVFFQDDVLATGRIREMCERLMKQNIHLTWSCYIRANVDYETLKMMKKAGCRYVHVGYESADETVLTNMKKGTTPEGAKKFTEYTKKAGLKVHGDFILGLPGESVDSIKKTINWAKNLGIEGYQFFIPQPEQGTPLYDYLKTKGYMTKDENISYPHLSNEELNTWRFSAMRQIYMTPNYMLSTVRHIESFDDFIRLTRTAMHVIPNILKS